MLKSLTFYWALCSLENYVFCVVFDSLFTNIFDIGVIHTLKYENNVHNLNILNYVSILNKMVFHKNFTIWIFITRASNLLTYLEWINTGSLITKIPYIFLEFFLSVNFKSILFHTNFMIRVSNLLTFFLFFLSWSKKIDYY